MAIQRSGEREQMILSLVQAGKFSSADAVIDESLRLVGERQEGPDDVTTLSQADLSPDRTANQLENLRRLGRKLDAMPSALVIDGLSNRDHDRILCGQ